MPSLAGSESSLVIRAGWSGDESLSFAFPLLQDQPDAMQVGRQHRQGNRTREAVRTMAANSVESPGRRKNNFRFSLHGFDGVVPFTTVP